MTAGIDRIEEATPYTDPRNPAGAMLRADDWTAFVLDRAPRREPGARYESRVACRSCSRASSSGRRGSASRFLLVCPALEVVVVMAARDFSGRGPSPGRALFETVLPALAAGGGAPADGDDDGR